MKVLLANPSCKQMISSGREKYFVRAGSRWPHSSTKRKNELPHYIPFPFFLAYTAALLLKDNFSIEVVDGMALDMTRDAFLQHVVKTAPEVVLFETTTPTIDYDLNLIREIKRQVNPKTVFCGTHATTFAEELLYKSPDIDYIILGEYELTALDLMHSLREGKSVGSIMGIAYRQSGTVIVRKRAPLIDPLDNLPFPARHLFPWNSAPDMNIYWDGFCQNRPAIQIHTSRGCPYRCYFCLWNQIMYDEGQYRLFSSSRVVDEIEHVVKKYGAREIYFDDDDFTVSKKHVLNICQEIGRRGLRVKWSCMGDVINLDEEEIREMSYSGCIGMKFGVESGSPEILKGIGKPMDLKRAKQISRWCNKYGIKTHAAFTIGLLGETRETLRENLDFAKSFDVDSIQVSICTPFPGTAFYKKVSRAGIIKYSSWEEFDGKSRELIQYPAIDGKEIVKFRSRFFRQWLLSRIFRLPWLFRQARNLIRSMKGTSPIFIMRRLFLHQLNAFLRQKF